MQRSRTDRYRTARTKSRPELHQLDVFLKVAEVRSFANAARLLSRTQPAISQAISRLEEIYGGELFERRRGAALALTAIGEAILPSARAILHTVDQQMVRAADAAQSRSGSLALGFFPGLACGPLRAGLTAFTRDSPNVKVQLIEGFAGELHRQLSERTIDLMIVGLMPNIASRDLEVEALWEERLLLALPATHPMTRAEPLQWKDVAALPLIIRSSRDESIAYRAMLRLVTGHQIDCEQHAVSRDALLDMVGMGKGATIVMESGMVQHDNVAFRPIVDEGARAVVEAVWPRADHNPLRHRLLTHLREAAAQSVGRVATPPTPATAPAPDRG